MNSKKSIGIMNFHRAYNYGSVLLSYSLQNFLKNSGFDAENIDFYQEITHKVYDIKQKVSSPKQLMRNILFDVNYLGLKERNKKFRNFIDKYIHVSKTEFKRSADLAENTPEYDAYICGSDQIWNPRAQDFNFSYLLDFVPDDKLKIAYAPSFGSENIPEGYEDKFKKLLGKINHLSIREKHGNKIIKKLTGRESEVVLDPVFLTSREKWLELSRDNKVPEDEYILIYSLDRSPELGEIARKLSEETGMKSYYIVHNFRKIETADEFIKGCGPREFLGVLSNASVVCTNSFHGTAFSIIFERPFLTVPHKSSNSRIINLLNELKVKNDQINDMNDTDLKNRSHWKKENVRSALRDKTELSKEFLLNALG